MPRPVNPCLSQWIAAYEAGATTYEIADEHDRTQPVVFRALKKAGVQMRRCGRRPDTSMRNRSVQLKAEGVETVLIAERIGRAAQTVRAHLRQARG